MPFNRPQPGTIVTLDALDLPDPENALCFGPFVLFPQQQLLFKHGEPVHLGSRALQLLVTLASRSGELLEKNELLALVWPKVVVEECNLRAQMTTLRRVLGDEGDFTHIVTVPGRGYRFVAPVTVREASVAPAMAPRPEPELPSLSGSVMGHEHTLQALGEELRGRRLITLTGSGGIGKSTLALALANALEVDFPGGRTLLDLTDTLSGVAQQLASALGIEASPEPLTELAARLGNSRHLLILDNCDQALEDTAATVEALLRLVPSCHILLTSREPLHIEGEFVHEVPPLCAQTSTHACCADEALTAPAVRLLVERAAALDSGFRFSDAEVPAAQAICRMLDGNPLAIEIAASHVRAFGLGYLVELLEGEFRLQMASRRNSSPRHRTLQALLDWSHARLSAQEQAMLHQLSVFAGSFTLASAKAVVDVSPGQFQDSAWLLEGLLDKSLLLAASATPVKRYRLTHSTRLYAAQKLGQHPNARALAQRHARYTLGEQRRASLELEQLAPEAWLAQQSQNIDCVRAALTWCFGDQGDPTLGVELVLASVPLWLRLSLIEECHEWVNSGLLFAAASTRQRMQLLTISASVMTLAQGAGQAIRTAWQHVIDDARTLGDYEHELRGLWGLWHDLCCCNRHQEALQLAERYIQLSDHTNSLERRLLGRRMRASPLFYMADFEGARQAINEALSFPQTPRSHVVDSHFDQSIAARSLKAQVQLLQGQVGQALLTLEGNVDAATGLHHPASLWYTLTFSAIPVTLLVGHEKRSREFLQRLGSSLDGHEMPVWRLFIRCFEHILAIRDGQVEDGVRGLSEALDHLQALGGSPLYCLVRSEYAQGLARLGLAQLAVEIIEQTLDVTAARQEFWFRPELLRVKSQLLAQSDNPEHRAQVLETLNLAMAEANQQGARFWAGRIAANLSQLANRNTTPLQPREVDQSWEQRRQERQQASTQVSHT
ncbi:ATP-binding protein [Pseudomonas sp. NPDC089554]|uniref:ATP-binding protein n=1 Tax=Pseudomonas sp. NPDC089554 TaxID=3390653 RepID=UPI003D092DCE